jgi:hypothetical protein
MVVEIRSARRKSVGGGEMMRLAAFLFIGLFACPVLAQEGVTWRYNFASEKLWSKCIWKQVPTSGANWIGFVPIQWQPVSETDDNKYQFLQLRLEAACRGIVKKKSKNTDGIPGFNWESVRQALIRTKPRKIKADRSNPKAYICRMYEEGKYVGYTLKMFEPGSYGPDTVTKCFLVQSDGTLTNA